MHALFCEFFQFFASVDCFFVDFSCDINFCKFCSLLIDIEAVVRVFMCEEHVFEQIEDAVCN